MEKSEIREIAKQLAACEYILQTGDSSEEDKDKAERHMIKLALSIPDLETMAQIDELVSAILENKLRL